MSPDYVSALLRSLGFVLLFQAAGAALFVGLAADILDRSEPAIRRMQLGSAMAAVVVVALHLALDAARLSGDYAGMIDRGLQALVLATSSARAHAVQVIGLVAIAVGALRPGRVSRLIAMAGAVLVASAFLLTGHTQTHEWRAALGPLLLVHVLIVAFWFGSLLPLYAGLRQESVLVAIALLRRFSGMAVWLVPLIAMVGVLLLLAIAHGLPDFQQPYGSLILAKALGFFLLMGLAALNRNRLTSALENGSAAAQRAIRLTLLTETALIAGVLAITAVMTSFYSP